MRIASVTVTFQDEKFIRPHFKMLSSLDEHIVLIGRRPFKDYLEAGLVEPTPDRSEEILRNELPNVHIIHHDFDYFCGDIFNIGLKKARELGCDAILKLDPDMFLTKYDWDILIRNIEGSNDWDTLLLDYKKNTIAYKKDFDHGVPARIFPVGLDPHVVRTNQSFVQDGVKIRATGRQKVLYGMMIHHMTGWRNNVDDTELRRVEALQGFPGWSRCPEEIIKMFDENISHNTNN